MQVLLKITLKIQRLTPKIARLSRLYPVKYPLIFFDITQFAASGL